MICSFILFLIGRWTAMWFIKMLHHFFPNSLLFTAFDKLNKRYLWIPTSDDDSFHICKSDTDGFLFVGRCKRCFHKPASVIYIHENRLGHAVYCENCFKKDELQCHCGEMCYSFKLRIKEWETQKNLKRICKNNTCICVGTCYECFTSGVTFPLTRSVVGVPKKDLEIFKKHVHYLQFCRNHKKEENENMNFYEILQTSGQPGISQDNAFDDVIFQFQD